MTTDMLQLPETDYSFSPKRWKSLHRANQFLAVTAYLFRKQKDVPTDADPAGVKLWCLSSGLYTLCNSQA